MGDERMKYVCGICGFVYNEADGDPDGGIAAGTVWENVADGYACPLCGADKDAFEAE